MDDCPQMKFKRQPLFDEDQRQASCRDCMSSGNPLSRLSSLRERRSCAGRL